MAYLTNVIKNVEGDFLNIDDSYKLKDYKLKGDTSQNTTIGKNLFQDKYVLAPSDNINAILDSDTYTISTEDNNNFGYSIVIKLFDGSGNVITTANHVTSNVSISMDLTEYTYILNCSNKNSVRFTIDNDYQLNIGLPNSTGTRKIQVEKGSTKTDFEEYSGGLPSPNPEFPQEIQVVTGRQEINVIGKNLFDKNNATTAQAYISSTGLYRTSTNNVMTIIFPVIPQETYTVSKMEGTTFRLAYSNNMPSNNDALLGLIDATTNTSATITVGNEAKYLLLYVYSTNETMGIETMLNSIQIEKGLTATNYEPYQSQSYEINLGKNLFNFEEYTHTGSGLTTVINGTNLKITGTATSTSKNITVSLKNTYKAGTYTFSITQPIPRPIILRFYDENGTTINSYTISANRTLISFTLNGTEKQYRLIFNPANNTTYDIDINLQLEKGSSKTTYVPYKTPIELCKIVSYQDRIFKTKGKNLYKPFSYSRTNNGVDFTYNTNGTITASGTSTSNSCVSITRQVAYDNEYYVTLEAGTYTLSGGIDNTKRLQIFTADTGTNLAGTDSTGTASFTIIETTPVYIRAIINSGTTVNNTFYPQLEKGTQATSYEPYGKGWYIEKNVGKVVFDGSEISSNWSKINSSNNTIFAYKGITDITTSLNSQTGLLLSDKFTPTSWNTLNGTDLIGISNNYSISNGAIRLGFGLSSSITTVDLLKSWLALNNVIVYYVLGTPTYTEITDTELINQLEASKLFEGINNITVDSSDLSAILNLDYYSTDNPYKDAIYSQDDKNHLKIWFNDVELQDAGRYCEKITRTARILPDDGKQRFSLDNFISTYLEIILHNVDLNIIQDQVKVSIGTDIGNNTYEYIPLGVFNIQDKPEINGNRITIKLRDNRVKFDFNYNGQPLIESLGGSATKRQILDDICEQAGVENTIDYFANENDRIGLYDSSIQATTYVSYLMEQAGLIATIDRYGRLMAVDLSNLDNWKIPLSIIEGWEKGEPYKIERVVYESGIIKYETSDDDSLDTLYINSTNPYVFNDAQVEAILDKLQNFEIDSITTKRVLGNPAIDPYDIIEVYNDLDNTNDIVFKTLGNTNYTFNGVHRDTFNTVIGKEERTENVTKNSSDAKFKRAFTEIDQVEGTVKIHTSQIEEVTKTANNATDSLLNYYTIEQSNELIQQAQTGLTNTFTTTGGANIFRNTGLWFETTDSNNPYEFWTGIAEKQKEEKASNMRALLLQNSNLSQEQFVPNGKYTVSFKYKKLIALANAKVSINDVEYMLEEITDTEFIQVIEVSSQHISIKFTCDIDNGCEIYDLMANAGEAKLAYSQNQNETTTDTVNISKGITITSSDLDVTFKANADGIRTLDKNGSVKTKFTDVGMETEEAKIKSKSQIVGTLWQEVGEQTWITRL